MSEFFKALIHDITDYFKAPLDFGGPITTGQLIIFAVAAGFLICAVISIVNKLLLGKFVGFLIENGASSPEKAVCTDGKIKVGYFIRKALKSNGVFSKIVKTDNERYYILPSDISRAESLYSKNGASPLLLIVTVVALLIIAAVAYKVIPALLNMSADFAASLHQDANIA